MGLRCLQFPSRFSCLELSRTKIQKALHRSCSAWAKKPTKVDKMIYPTRQDKSVVINVLVPWDFHIRVGKQIHYVLEMAYRKTGLFAQTNGPIWRHFSAHVRQLEWESSIDSLKKICSQLRRRERRRSKSKEPQRSKQKIPKNMGAKKARLTSIFNQIVPLGDKIIPEKRTEPHWRLFSLRQRVNVDDGCSLRINSGKPDLFSTSPWSSSTYFVLP